MGMNPKRHRLMYSKVNTFEVLFSLLANRIDAKKIALIEVGLPKTRWDPVSESSFLGGTCSVFLEADFFFSSSVFALDTLTIDV